MRNALIGAVLTFTGYCVATIVIVLMLGGEVAPSAFAFGLFASPIALLLGGIMGGLASKAEPGKVLIGGLALGMFLPLLAYGAIISFSSSQHNQRNAALNAEAEAAMEEAKKEGFPFPGDAKPFLPGDVRTSLSNVEVRKFYDTATKGQWQRLQAGGTVWYARKSKSIGMVDLIRPRGEFGQTVIYFGTHTPETMKLRVAGSFGSLVKGKDWAGASSLCTPGLQRKMGPSALKATFTDVEPDATGFVRKYFPSGATATIAINVSRNLGANRSMSGEIGFEFTDDLIPQIKRIEF